MFFNTSILRSSKLKLLSIPVVAFTLSACDDVHHDDHYGSDHYHDSNYEHNDHHHHNGNVAYGEPLHIDVLELIDGTDFASDGIYGAYTPEIIVSPEDHEDIFDILWDVGGSEHYEANVYINDQPQLKNSIRVNSQECELGKTCDTSGIAYCSYEQDYVGCSSSAFIDQTVYIGDLLKNYPQKLYIVLETCDLDWGECDKTYQEFYVY